MPRIGRSTSEKAVEALRASPDGLTREELAEKLGLPLPSVRRDVGALIAGGVVAENGARKNKAGKEVKVLVAAALPTAGGAPGEVVVRGEDDEVTFAGTGTVDPPAQGKIQFAPVDPAAQAKIVRLEGENAILAMKVEQLKRDDSGVFERRFWAMVDKQAPSAPGSEGCWLWKGPINSEGQGAFPVAGQGVRAKRLAVELQRGEALGDAHVGACKASRLCVNPAHLGVKLGHKPGQRREGTEEADPRQAPLFAHACPAPGCGQGFDSKGDLARHYQDAHNPAPEETDPRPPDLPPAPAGMKVG